MKNLNSRLLGTFLFLNCWVLRAQENLIIVGGGPRPPAALEKFSELARNSSEGNVLVITWATDSPAEYAEAFLNDLQPHFSGPTQVSLVRPYTDADRAAFLSQLDHATGVFFTGGDQSLVMDVLEGDTSRALTEALHLAYTSGVVFGGTSAGTAIMSNPMIVGDRVDGITPLRPGLGFLDLRLIVDQHFSQRRRKKRLLAALNQTGLNYGVGVDEATALLVRDRADYSVIGENHVKVYTRQGETSRFHEDVYVDGDSFKIP